MAEAVDTDIQQMRDNWLNREFDEVTFDLDGQRMSEYAKSSGELAEKFVNVDHPDFQAPATFVSTLVGGRLFPEDFPKLSGVQMDAGKSVEWKAPIRAGKSLTGKSHLHDIYTKSGRSGRMVFLVTRMEIFDGATHVANADTRTVVREKS